MSRSDFTTLITSNEKINGIMKIVKSLKESGFSIKTIGKTIKTKSKEQKGEFIGLLLGKLGARSLWNLLAGKGTVRAA